MSEFERKLPPVRLAATHYGDTLQIFADREMGDANRWPELVWINSLTHPYITDDPERVSPGVVLVGTFLKVPAPVGVYSSSADYRIYERDCALTGKLLTADAGGDLLVASGIDNLKQQLSHVVVTPRGQAIRHPEYGCMIWRLLGTVNGPTAGKLGAEYIKASLKSDYRVSGVASSVAEVSGDQIRATARAVAIDGSHVDVVIA